MSPRPTVCQRHLARNPTLEDIALPMHCDDGGSHMRKLFVALLLLVVGGGAASQANLALASIGDDTQVGDKLVNGQIVSELRTRAAKLRTSAGNPGDTTWVG